MMAQFSKRSGAAVVLYFVFVSIFAFVFAGVCVFVCVSVSLPESSGLWWRKVCQRVRESRCSAVASPSPVKRTLRISSHTCLLQRWRWWTPCSKSSSTRRGRRRGACGGFRTSSLFQFQRGECCCKACCCTNRYHTPAESRSRLIKSFANLQIFSVQINWNILPSHLCASCDQALGPVLWWRLLPSSRQKPGRGACRN